MNKGDNKMTEKKQKESFIPNTFDLNEFKDKGYLQEANRRFFHPLGLALSVRLDEKDDKVKEIFVMEVLDDPEGFCFGYKNRTTKQNLVSMNKKKFIDEEMFKRKDARIKMFGSMIEEIVIKIDIK